jgi:PAS domain S-box-containing protein
MHALIKSLPTAIVLIDDAVIVGWNDAAASLYGWPTHEVIGRRFDDVVVDGADGGEVAAILGQVQARGRWEGNFRVKRRDGVLLVSSFFATKVRDGDAERVAWVATDAVDQHLAEQERDVLLSAQSVATRELEATVGLLEALLECAPIGIAMFDLELYCTHVNTTFARMIGAEELPVGAYLDDLATLPSDVAADLRRVVTTGRAITDRRIALRTLSPSGARQVTANYFPIYAGHGVPSGAGLTWTDVTEAERAEDERMLLAQRASAVQQRLAMLSSTSAALVGARDVATLLDRLARVVAPNASDWCIIEMIGKSGLIEHAAVAHADREMARLLRDELVGTPAASTDESIIADVRRTGQARLISGTELDLAIANAARFGPHRRLSDLALTSAIVVPIKTRGEFIGVLIMGNSGAMQLTEDDLDVAVEIAHRAALGLERAITYQNEHVLAEQLQQALLPAALPRIPSCRITTRYSAAADSATVGGDWFDVIRLAPTLAVLCVGDVVGHDTAAAVGMSRLRHVIHAFALESAASSADGRPDPAEILGRVDRIVLDQPSAWATAIIAVLDTESLEMTWSNAGHPPMLVGRDGTVWALEDARGTMLGASLAAHRTTAHAQLFVGDRLLMYTDGLFERRTESIDVGLERLADAMRDYRNQPLERMCDEIIRTMLADVDQADDIAILAADIVPHVDP